jgi:hypothetical protein
VKKDDGSCDRCRGQCLSVNCDAFVHASRAFEYCSSFGKWFRWKVWCIGMNGMYVDEEAGCDMLEESDLPL